MPELIKSPESKQDEEERDEKGSGKSMTNILKSEFYKLKQSKAFYICTAACAALALFIAFEIQHETAQAVLHPQDPELTSFLAMRPHLGGAWFIGQSFSQGMLSLICAVFVSIFVAVEFNFGTMKNIVSKGFNRIQIYIAKFIASAAASLVMLIVFMVVAGIAGTVLWGFNPNGAANVGNLLPLFFTQALLIVAFTAVFVFVAMTLRSNGASIAVNISAVVLFDVLLQAANLLIGNSVTLSNYWIAGNISKLATLSPTGPDVTRGVIVAVVYSIAAILAGGTLFKKQDIK